MKVDRHDTYVHISDFIFQKLNVFHPKKIERICTSTFSTSVYHNTITFLCHFPCIALVLTDTFHVLPFILRLTKMITLRMIFYSSMGMFNIFVNICMSFSVKPPVAVAKAAYYTIRQQPNSILQPNQYSFLRQEMKMTKKSCPSI